MMTLEQINQNTMDAINTNNEKIAALKAQIKSLENSNQMLMDKLMEFIQKGGN